MENIKEVVDATNKTQKNHAFQIITITDHSFFLSSASKKESEEVNQLTQHTYILYNVYMLVFTVTLQWMTMLQELSAIAQQRVRSMTNKGTHSSEMSRHYSSASFGLF